MKQLCSLLLLAILLLIYGCANTGSPGGGPKDEKPPRLVKSTPAMNQLNYDKKKVEIFFDELVSVENASEKVIISPPQLLSPIIKAINNKISVVFLDTLIDNTTYTIDFTDAIVDYNEKNKFGDFAFSFSTGPQIDSLRVGGFLLDASNLNPVPGVLIGLHKDLHDSIFIKKGFSRISKTNQDGLFSVKGISRDSFRVYALGDKNRDYKFDQPGEPIAFYDSIAYPWTEPCLKSDTIWKDSITVDSIWTRTVTCYKPDDIVLLYFTEDFGRQYLAKRERTSRDKIAFTFGYKSETLPKLRLLNYTSENWNLPEINPTKDTLVYWITDTTVISMDTLKIELDYFKTDSINRLVPALDTLFLISRKAVQKNRAKDSKKKDEVETPVPVIPLGVDVSLQGTMDIYAVPTIVWETPVKEITGDPWHLAKKKDSLWVKVPVKVEKDSVMLRNYFFKAKWEYGEEYRFEIDSGMVVGLYGKTNDKYSRTFRILEEEEYSRLILAVTGLKEPAFVELLDKSDKVVCKEKLVNNIADFKNLKPGTYYIRAIEDLNGNLRWDTGNYAKKLQPERVYYRPVSVELRANWDVEEDWNALSVPTEIQKPKELKQRTR